MGGDLKTVSAESVNHASAARAGTVTEGSSSAGGSGVDSEAVNASAGPESSAASANEPRKEGSDSDEVGEQKLAAALEGVLVVTTWVVFVAIACALIIGPILVGSLDRFNQAAKSLLAVTAVFAFSSGLRDQFVDNAGLAISTMGYSMILGVLLPLAFWMALDAGTEFSEKNCTAETVEAKVSEQSSKGSASSVSGPSSSASGHGGGAALDAMEQAEQAVREDRAVRQAMLRRARLAQRSGVR